MRHRDCPACGRTVPKSGLEVAPSAPAAAAITRPRLLCPHCGVELRASNRSLIPSLVLFLCGLTLLLGGSFLPAELAGAAEMVGTLLLLICVVSAYWFHRWEAVKSPPG